MKNRIKIEKLGKQYRLGEVGTGTISHDLNRWWAKIRGKEDPYTKVGEVNDRTLKSENDYVWVLKDINLEIKEGEIVGVIGRNGAGKSTLLKVLSKITGPTEGEIKINGRIASLLEVGTGMHPELTGKENIFLNGSILGMTKNEIQSKFDEIVEFAGVSKYVDTPLKRYSSGMQVRLGFAVAAFLEPEILIVDEVLAVGDAEFQKKAIGKMKDVSQGQGRTVLFVSHNMASIKALCNRAIVLDKGRCVFAGKTEDAVSYYINNNSIVKTNHLILNESNDEDVINLKEIKISANAGETITIESGIEVVVKFSNKKINATLMSSIVLFTEEEFRLFEAPCYFAPSLNSKKGVYTQKCIIPPYLLNSGNYKLMFVVGEAQKYVICKKEDLMSFDVEDTQFNKGANLNRLTGILRPNITWDVSLTE